MISSSDSSIPLKYRNRGRKEQVPAMKYVILRCHKPSMKFTNNKAPLLPFGED